MRKLLLFLLLSLTAGASFICPFPRQVCLRRADLVVVGQVVAESPGPDIEPDPSRFLYMTPPIFGNRNYDRSGKFGVLRVDRWIKGAPREEVKVIHSAQTSYLAKEASVWMLQWNEACKAYQFDFLFGPGMQDVPDLGRIVKAQSEQVLLSDHHGLKYWIQPISGPKDYHHRNVEIETVVEGDLSQVQLEVWADDQPIDPSQINDFRWGFISIPNLSVGNHTISVSLVNGPYRTAAGKFQATVP